MTQAGGIVVVRVALVPAQGRLAELDYCAAGETATSAAVGARVVVPLGSRRATGVVLERLDESPRAELRDLLAVVDAAPVLDGDLLRLCRWMAEYYLVPIGDAVEAALPGGLRLRFEKIARCLGAPPAGMRPEDAALLQQIEAAGGSARVSTLNGGAGGARAPALKRLQRAGAISIEERLARQSGPTRTERLVALARRLGEAEEAALRRRRPALHALYAQLQGRGGGPLPVSALRSSVPQLNVKLRALAELGAVRLEEVEVYRDPTEAQPSSQQSSAGALRLTPAQAAAVEALIAAIDSRSFRPFLLLGVTGSGKTEVYLRAVEAVVDAGGGALVLVPEISLTHQLVDRIRGRFGAAVAVLHSGLSDGERWDEWRRLARGEARIAVGARSAVFAPVRKLALVVVDEEHDGAYKQEDGVRYNARDVAVMRAKLSGCTAVLGSATPSMESFDNGQRGRYRLLELGERVEGRPLPEVEIVDLRRRVARSHHGMPLSPELIAALQANHAARGQSLVFINRRGFSNFLQCSLCGEAMMCPNCSVALTWHRCWRSLRCHHCDHTVPQPALCPTCAEPGLRAWGAGTEQVERVMQEIVPGARIGRMDRDTTARRGAQRRLLQAWEARQFDILVGTQMITKGHDIPGVTFVGVLLADQSLNFPDFRAAERTFQLLTQVAGRAGRGARVGRVVVQTFQPRHYSLQRAALHDFHGFAADELAQRRDAGYPPFSRLVLVRCDGESSTHVEEIAAEAARWARQQKAVQVLGPAPAPLERTRGRWHWQILLRGRQGAAVRQVAAGAREAVRQQARRTGVRVIVDVDPYSML